MFKRSPARIYRLFHVVLPCSLACSHSGGAEPETNSGSSTTDGATAPEVPTTGSDSAAPTTTTAGTSTAGEPPATSDAGADTTMGGTAGCGDGAVDPGEECDDGAFGNADHLFCTESCTLNVCATESCS